MPPASNRRPVVITADDFGLSSAVNEAVEIAHRDGVLAATSLMVAAPHAGDAVARAKRLPSLKVGLHLVLVEGDAALGAADIPDLVDSAGRFPAAQAALGMRYFFTPGIRRQLEAEIRAQFRSFAATSLVLDHVNTHKHMHMHPTVLRLILEVGSEFGMRALRLPCEPPGPIARVDPAHRDTAGAQALRLWARMLAGRARRAGLVVNDWIFGLAWSGAFDSKRAAALAAYLPQGIGELYFHPAVSRPPELVTPMPGYRHEDEFAALLDDGFRTALAAHGLVPSGYEALWSA